MNRSGPERDEHRHTHTAARVAAIAATLLAFLIYRPDRPLPFDILDFSEFLPLLRDTDSFVARTQRLVGYYASQGRANLIPYVLMSAKWELFGDWSPGWQWSRFGVMAGVVVLAFRLLRRLGAQPLAATIGAGVFLAAPAAARGWIRLTMAEPLGTLLLLGLCHVVLPARRLWAEKRRWLGALALTLAILLTKEMLVVSLVLPVALMCLTDDAGRVAPPRSGRPALAMGVATLVLSIACLVPMARLTLRVSHDAFSSQFGAVMRGPGDTVAAWLATLIPFDPARAVPRSAIGATLALYLVVLIGCWSVRLRVATLGLRGEMAWLGLGLGVPLLGAMEYVPWPAYQPFYAIPYLTGTSLLLALGLTSLLGRSRRWGMAATAACGMLFGFALADAQAQAARAAASQYAHRRLVTRLHQATGIDRVGVASDRRVPQAWQGLGPTLHRYAAAVGSPIPPAVDLACTGADSAIVQSRGTAFVFYGSLCPHQVDDEPIVERYRRFDVGRLRVVEDSLRVDVLSPRPTADVRR